MQRPLCSLRIVALAVSTGVLAGAASGQEEPSAIAYAPSPPHLGADELDQLLGPIALYPDPLIAQILPAATYPLDVVKAARLVRSGATAADIDRQDWEPCVKAIAHYPSVIEMLDHDLDWTEQLGQAFMSQPDDIMLAIQRLRDQARSAGNLVDSPEIQVVVEDDCIRVIPSNPEIIYVPIYEPRVVYHRYERPLGFGPCITFSFGMVAGIWLDLDCDWREHCCYRPGWTWDHWREHIVLERGRVVRVNRSFEPHRGQRPPTAWERNARQPLRVPARPRTPPRQFDQFRGREPAAAPHAPPPLPPRPQTDRARAPEPRQPTHAFDPRQTEGQADRYSQRGITSQGGKPPVGGPAVAKPTPVVSPSPPPVGKPAPAPPVPAAKPAPTPPARVPVPPVKIAPPPPAAAAPSRPTLTGGGTAGQRGNNSRDHK